LQAAETAGRGLPGGCIKAPASAGRLMADAQ
jgi:hypothetical protein